MMQFAFVGDSAFRNSNGKGGKSKVTLGPLDQRLRKRRCDNCARAHRRCDGHSTCSHCLRLELPCSYPARSQEPERPADPFKQSLAAWRHQSPSPRSLWDPTTGAIDYFFGRFLPSNDFSGRPCSFFFDVGLYHHSNAQVHYALVAVGALSMRSVVHNGLRECNLLAMESYQQALMQLSRGLSGAQGRNDALANLWTMLLLGIFELISDNTGQAFLQHIGIGVAQSVESLGPDFFREAQARRFFIEWRSFELSRCVLLTQTSVLTRQHWTAHSRWVRELELEDGRLDQHFEEFVEIVLSCADFVRRAAEASRPTLTGHAASLANLMTLPVEGHQLRRKLQSWGEEAYARRALHPACNDTDLLGLIYYSAISIYISGPFDYSPIWDEHRIATPALSQEDVDFHADTILTLSDQALQGRKVAGAALLFPLRIVGARARGARRGKMENVEELLEKIGGVYAASEAIAEELT